MIRAIVKSGLALLLFAAVFSPASTLGQPTVAVYFDEALTQRTTTCPSAPLGSVIDTLYVAASGFTAPIEGIEYRVSFPPFIEWLSDIGHEDGLTIGNSDFGLAKTFFSPLDASSPAVVGKLLVIWMCTNCYSGELSIEITPSPSTNWGEVIAVRSSDLSVEYAVGGTSTVCPIGSAFDSETAAARPQAAPALPAYHCTIVCPAGDGEIIIPGPDPGDDLNIDYDDDGVVSIPDLGNFALSYNEIVADPGYDYQKDLNCDLFCDLKDFVLFTRHWGHSATTPIESRTWGHVKALYSD